MSRRGGTGRRAGLKIRWAKVRVGSTPTAGTTLFILLIFLFLSSSPQSDLPAKVFSPLEIEKIVGREAPDFTIEDLKGNRVSLSMFKGRPVLLNIWATWCPYCKEERPVLNTLYKEYSDRGLIIVAVSIDRKVEKVKTYLEDIPVDYMVLIDRDGVVARLYRVYTLPTSFLIDKDGKVRQMLMGSRKWLDDNLRTIIENLLKE